jgi:hypothetical protein
MKSIYDEFEVLTDVTTMKYVLLRFIIMQSSACSLLLAGFLLHLLFHPEDVGSTFLRNVGGFLPDYTMLQPSRLQCKLVLTWPSTQKDSHVSTLSDTQQGANNKEVLLIII